MDERIYGLLGRKLGHSWSVPIHAALGNGAYRLLELEPDGLAPFLHRKDIGGLNVTIPYKRDVMPLCDEIDPAAEAIGSVNTIVRCADGKLVGYNTDIDGFLYMACRAGISLSGKKVMYPGNGQSPVDLSVFPVCQGVLDVIYNPRRTALLLQAEARSIPCSDGLPMLVAQAVAAEERFFNRSIPAGENERILVQLRREMTNLILIGMPGSGKTTVGEALSRLTGRGAVDLHRRHPPHRRRYHQDGGKLRGPPSERPHLSAGAGSQPAAHRGPAPVPGGGSGRHVAGAGAPVRPFPGRGD